ncbi:MAG: hypothetical protein QHH02_08265, partial [Syntrophomonadaceae bacterium]|nr:hypothetical protein [Syntrophomonadaceae bacterium]
MGAIVQGITGEREIAKLWQHRIYPAQQHAVSGDQAASRFGDQDLQARQPGHRGIVGHLDGTEAHPFLVIEAESARSLGLIHHRPQPGFLDEEHRAIGKGIDVSKELDPILRRPYREGLHILGNQQGIDLIGAELEDIVRRAVPAKGRIDSVPALLQGHLLAGPADEQGRMIEGLPGQVGQQDQVIARELLHQAGDAGIATDQRQGRPHSRLEHLIGQERLAIHRKQAIGRRPALQARDHGGKHWPSTHQEGVHLDGSTIDFQVGMDERNNPVTYPVIEIERPRIHPQDQATLFSFMTAPSTGGIDRGTVAVHHRSHQLDGAPGTATAGAARSTGTACTAGAALGASAAGAAITGIRRHLARRSGLARSASASGSACDPCCSRQRISSPGPKLGVVDQDTAPRNDLHGPAAGPSSTAGAACTAGAA